MRQYYNNDIGAMGIVIGIVFLYSSSFTALSCSNTGFPAGGSEIKQTTEVINSKRLATLTASAGEPNEFTILFSGKRDSTEYSESTFMIWKNKPWATYVIHLDTDNDGAIDTMRLCSAPSHRCYIDYNVDGVLDVMEDPRAEQTFVLFQQRWVPTLVALKFGERVASINNDGSRAVVEFFGREWLVQGAVTEGGN